MKKLLIVLSTLILLTSGVMAAGSQSVDPVLNVADGSYAINGEGAEGMELKGLNKVQELAKAAEGDDLAKVNDAIKAQNNSGAAKIVDKVQELLKSELGKDWLVIGKGFYDMGVYDKASGEEVHNGLTFKVKLQQITDRTEEVGLIHYSLNRGMEYVKANSFSAKDATAEFTLKDSSPVMFIIRYKDGQTAAYNPSKTGVDGSPANTFVRMGALSSIALAAGIATVVALKKKNS